VSDELPDRLRRLGAGPRAHLFDPSDLDPDPILQEIVEEASSALSAPIALVSLVLDHIQAFPAQVGLPPDLARARATDRDLSFCQVVVADRAPLIVPAAEADARVPQGLVRSHGVRAYLGVPLDLGQGPLGSLCVIDTRPHPFTAGDRDRLEALARKAEARLVARRSAAARHLTRFQRATAPTFAELRNLLTVIDGGLVGARLFAAELRAGRDGGAGPSLRQLDDAQAQLEASLEDVQGAAQALSGALLAIQAASAGDGPVADPSGLLDAALALSVHHTRILGEVVVEGRPPPGPLQVPGGRALAALAGLLSELALAARAAGGRGPLWARWAPPGEPPAIDLGHPDLDPEALVPRLVALELGLAGDLPAAEPIPGGVRLHLSAAP
jgi:GAF domain-containing protein